ncbi:hypothetical protein LTR53_010137 [Teratosphaeriaceae sp. CCFEE 6253]|nr:hypothetical protein LTR53_010137 [Teratosphaeriaceae sp. CCFEE 6253]
MKIIRHDIDSAAMDQGPVDSGDATSLAQEAATSAPPAVAPASTQAAEEPEEEIAVWRFGMHANGYRQRRSRAFAQRPSNNGNGQGNQSRNPNPNQNQVPPNRVNSSSPSAYGQPSISAAPPSPSLSHTMSANDQARNINQGVNVNRVPIFFREDHSGFIVKGNFMTLAAKPHLVEEGEWMAHQIVEQQRLLSGMIKCVEGEAKTNGRAVCNEQSCPTMSAGSTTYTWIDTARNPINLPAATYIKHIQTWVTGKIQDQSIFPTDTFSSAPPLPSIAQLQADPNHWLGKTSGFPQRFEVEVKNMYKQMFRCYAHLYWQHWLFFWDTSAHKELNTCFVHFVNVGRIHGLLSEVDSAPMQPLIDLWVKQGVLPEIKKGGEMPTPTSAGGAGAGAMPGAGGP